MDIATASRWPFFVFLSGSMFCLLSSSVCHLFSCHSHHLNLMLLRMDYVGITIMIITSFFPPIYYIFECDPLWQFVYLGGITAMGMFTVVTMLSPSLSSSKYRGFRAFLFSSMGLFGIVPTIHALIVNWGNPQRNTTLTYELAMATSYLTGTFIYVTRIPERWKPGWFDLAGHSHQIFHVFVVMGALAHYGATLVILDSQYTLNCERIMQYTYVICDHNFGLCLDLCRQGHYSFVELIFFFFVLGVIVSSNCECIFIQKKKKKLWVHM